MHSFFTDNIQTSVIPGKSLIVCEMSAIGDALTMMKLQRDSICGIIRFKSGTVSLIAYVRELRRRRFVYVRIYSGTLHLRDVIKISEKEKIKITENVCSDKR